MKTSIIAAGAALVASATATNNVKFINRCPYDIYFWAVGPAGSNLNGEDYERTLVPKHSGSVIHKMVNSETVGGGLSIKMRDVPRYRAAPAGIVQVEYNLQPSQNSLWYDLSAINCNMAAGTEDPNRCPLIDGGIKLYVPGRTGGKDRTCPKANCINNVCYNAYTEYGSWYNEPTFRCGAGADLVVETCTHNAEQQTHYDGAPYALNKPTSPDGTCGPKSKNNYTCKGSRWGECCSDFGFCGRSDKYCAAKTCIPAYGVCPNTFSGGNLDVSKDGTCGVQGKYNVTCKDSPFGQCCSEYGYCGDGDKFCNPFTCDKAFGACPDVSNSTTTAYVEKRTGTADLEKPESTEVAEPPAKSQPLPRQLVVPNVIESPEETTDPPRWDCPLC